MQCLIYYPRLQSSSVNMRLTTVCEKLPIYNVKFTLTFQAPKHCKTGIKGAMPPFVVHLTCNWLLHTVTLIIQPTPSQVGQYAAVSFILNVGYVIINIYYNRLHRYRCKVCSLRVFKCPQQLQLSSDLRPESKHQYLLQVSQKYV